MGLFYKDANGNINTVDGSQIQFTVLPTPSADLVGKIYQYIGNTTLTYINGWFYKCVPGETSGTYEWKEIELYKQATDTSLGVVKPDGVTIVMDPDGTIHAMGGGKIKLGNVSGASVTSDKRVVSIRWTDPEDVVQGGIVFAKWAGTKIMKKVGSAPTGLDDEDATLLIDSTIRNAYSSVALTDSNVEYGETYYYKFFPYSEDEAVTSGSCLAATPTKIVIENVPTQSGALTYNGEAQTPSWTGYNPDALTLDVTAQINVGSYTATFTPNTDYIWWDGTNTTKTAPWSISNIVIAAVPTQSGTLNYTGSVQTPTWNGYDTDELTISGDTSGTEIGTYTATFIPKINYEWYDGTTEGKTATWKIDKAIITTVPTQQGTLTYDGTEQIAVWNNFDPNQLTIANDTGTNAGTYTASFTPKSGYKWSDGTTTAKTADFVIGKAEGSITLSTNSVILDDDHLTATVTVTNATGNITVNSSDSTMVTAVYENGVITLASPNKQKGTAIITVNVLEGNNYLSTTVSITVTNTFINYGSWSDSSDEDIIGMVAAADAGTLDLSLYWAIGDERTVHLSAYSPQPEQDVIMVLMNDGYMNQNSIHFVVGQKNMLHTDQIMNETSTNIGSWKESLMRNDLNTNYYNAFDSNFVKIFKKFNVLTAQAYNGSTNEITQDYFALFAEKEVQGSIRYSNSTEADALSQIKYYETSSNKVKYSPAQDYRPWHWYCRSPHSETERAFCKCYRDGDPDYGYANVGAGVSPFGCI